MSYLSYTVVNGVVKPGSKTAIDATCIFQESGNIWSLDGPTLGYLCSIAVAFVNVSVGRVTYDPRVLNGSNSSINFSNWGTAIQQPDGRFVISI